MYHLADVKKWYMVYPKVDTSKKKTRLRQPETGLFKINACYSYTATANCFFAVSYPRRRAS